MSSRKLSIYLAVIDQFMYINRVTSYISPLYHIMEHMDEYVWRIFLDWYIQSVILNNHLVLI